MTSLFNEKLVVIYGSGSPPHNNSLQRTFDPPPVFAAAKNERRLKRR